MHIQERNAMLLPTVVLYCNGVVFRKFLDGSLKMKGELVDEEFSVRPLGSQDYSVTFPTFFIRIDDRDRVTVTIPRGYQSEKYAYYANI